MAAEQDLHLVLKAGRFRKFSQVIDLSFHYHFKFDFEDCFE